jgi:DNA polymerase-3 subunit gamma/tau
MWCLFWQPLIPSAFYPQSFLAVQRFDFRRIPLDSMVAHLREIADAESIKINQEALILVAQIAQGGLRDAESLLDQLSLLEGEITVDAVWDLVGSVPEQDLLDLIEAIAADNSTLILEKVRKVMDRGREPLIVLQNLAGLYRDLLIAQATGDRHDLVALTSSGWQRLQQLAPRLSREVVLQGQKHLRDAEVQIKNTTQPRLWLEVTLLGLQPSAFAIAESVTSVQSQQSQTSKAVATPTTQPQAGLSRSNIENISVSNTGRSPDQIATSAASTAPIPNQIPSAAPPVQPPAIASEPQIAAIPEPVNDIPATPQPIPTATQASPPPSAPNVAEMTVPVPPIPEAYGIDLHAAWQQLLDSLPTPARSLLSDHGQFLGVNGNQVQIGLKNKALKEIAERKEAEITEACDRIFQRQVKVKFEVGRASPKNSRQSSSKPNSDSAAQDRSTPGNRDRPSSPPVNSVARDVNHAASNLNTSNNASNPIVPSQSQPSQDLNTQTNLANPAQRQNLSNGMGQEQRSPGVATSSPNPANSTKPTESTLSTTDIPTKIQEFANFFKAEIVSLDEDDADSE